MTNLQPAPSWSTWINQHYHHDSNVGQGLIALAEEALFELFDGLFSFIWVDVWVKILCVFIHRHFWINGVFYCVLQKLAARTWGVNMRKRTQSLRWEPSGNPSPISIFLTIMEEWVKNVMESNILSCRLGSPSTGLLLYLKILVLHISRCPTLVVSG